MTNDSNPGEWITTKEAAKPTGYTAAYFRQLIARGRPKARKIRRDWILDRVEVREYAEEMNRLGSDEHNPWRAGARKKGEEK